MLDWLFGRTPPKGRFSFGEKKEYITPSQLGVALVKISLDSTADTVRRMTQLPITHELKFYINQNPRAAQLQLILCELAASYTYCTMLNGINKTILDAILDGFKEGLRIMHKGAPESAIDSMMEFVKIYKESLNRELNQQKSIGTDASNSPTASLVIREIYSACEADEEEPIEESDEEMLIIPAMIHGILYIANLDKDLKLRLNI